MKKQVRPGAAQLVEMLDVREEQLRPLIVQARKTGACAFANELLERIGAIGPMPAGMNAIAGEIVKMLGDPGVLDEICSREVEI